MARWLTVSMVVGIGIIFVGNLYAACDVGEQIRDAARKGRNQELQPLLHAYPEFVDAPDADGFTPLLHAVNDKGDDETVNLLIKAKAECDVEEKHFRATPLIIAAALGKAGSADALLRAKASIDFQQVEGATALHASVQKGQEEMIFLLLAAKAEVNTHSKCFGVTPLMTAVERGDKAIVEALLTAKASIDRQQIEGGTALRVAIQNRHFQITLLLLEAKASVDLADMTGYTSLMAAARTGNREVVELLLTAGAVALSKDNDHYTALMHAQDRGHQDIAAMLTLAEERERNINELPAVVSAWSIPSCLVQ